MTEPPEYIKCQLTITNDTKFEVTNYSAKNVENDFVIVKKDGKEFPIENTIYSNARIIINTKIAQFQGTVRLNGWSTNIRSNNLTSGLYSKCTNSTLIDQSYGNGTVNYYLQKGMSL